MFKVTEVTSSIVLGTFDTFAKAEAFIDSIEAYSGYAQLLEKYGSLRRVQQEVVIEAK